MWSLIQRKPRQNESLRRTVFSVRPHLEALEERCLLQAGPLPVPTPVPAPTPTPMTGPAVIAAQTAFDSAASPSFLSSTQQFAQQSLAMLMSQDSTEATSLIVNGAKLGGLVGEGTGIILETLGEAAVAAAPFAEYPRSSSPRRRLGLPF